jgi:hypothetical protein
VNSLNIETEKLIDVSAIDVFPWPYVTNGHCNVKVLFSQVHIIIVGVRNVTFLQSCNDLRFLILEDLPQEHQEKG